MSRIGVSTSKVGMESTSFLVTGDSGPGSGSGGGSESYSSDTCGPFPNKKNFIKKIVVGHNADDPEPIVIPRPYLLLLLPSSFLSC